MDFTTIAITFPEWLKQFPELNENFSDDDAKMRLAIDLAAENVRRKTGGPFGAAIFEGGSNKLIAAGINQVMPLRNSCLHAETVAIMAAQQKLGTHNLNIAPHYELFTSCEPCAMCLGAILWSGVSRLVCAATKSDAERFGFDEGPVFQSSYDYLAERGIRVEREFSREKSAAVFDLYAANGGAIYNRSNE